MEAPQNQSTSGLTKLIGEVVPHVEMDDPDNDVSRQSMGIVDGWSEHFSPSSSAGLLATTFAYH